MRVRAALLAALIAVVAALALSAGGQAGSPRYRVELDNAFGLTTNADLRVAGVKVGKVSALDVDARTARAIATIEIADTNFGALHRDVFCTVQPQSLIGEYFLDCDPGKDPKPLEAGATIPVKQTAGTVPP